MTKETVDWTTGIWFFEDVDGDGWGKCSWISDVRFRKVSLTNDDCNVMMRAFTRKQSVCDRSTTIVMKARRRRSYLCIDARRASNVASVDGIKFSMRHFSFARVRTDIFGDNTDLMLYGLGDVILQSQDACCEQSVVRCIWRMLYFSEDFH